MTNEQMTNDQTPRYDPDLDSDYYKLLQIRVQEILAWLDASEPAEIEIEETDWRAMGSVIAAVRESRVDCDPDDLERAEGFWRKIADEAIDQGLTFTACNGFDGRDVMALRAFERLLENLRPAAEALEAQREDGARWVLINPNHPQGPMVLTNNDTGIYDDPWEALADLAEAQREYDNPDIYLSCLAEAFPTPAKRRLSDAELVQADACFQYVCDMIRLHNVPPRHILFGSTLARWFAGKSVIVVSSIPRSACLADRQAAGSANFEVCRIRSADAQKE